MSVFLAFLTIATLLFDLDPHPHSLHSLISLTFIETNNRLKVCLFCTELWSLATVFLIPALRGQ